MARNNQYVPASKVVSSKPFTLPKTPMVRSVSGGQAARMSASAYGKQNKTAPSEMGIPMQVQSHPALKGGKNG